MSGEGLGFVFEGDSFQNQLAKSTCVVNPDSPPPFTPDDYRVHPPSNGPLINEICFHFPATRRQRGPGTQVGLCSSLNFQPLFSTGVVQRRQALRFLREWNWLEMAPVFRGQKSIAPPPEGRAKATPWAPPTILRGVQLFLGSPSLLSGVVDFHAQNCLGLLYQASLSDGILPYILTQSVCITTFTL